MAVGSDRRAGAHSRASLAVRRRVRLDCPAASIVARHSPRPSQRVNLGDDFFELGLTEGDSHVDLLLAKLAEATPEIPRHMNHNT